MQTSRTQCVIEAEEGIMITVREKGVYEIVETKHRTKILYLDEMPYAWIHPKKIGEILVSSHYHQDSDVKVSSGNYILYTVEDEDFLTDLQHLELEYGHGTWQGYLLPTGLPNNEHKKARIIPTDQLITHETFFKNHLVFSKPALLIHAGGGAA